MIDISQYSGNFALSDNINSLGREFNFDYNYNTIDTYSTWQLLTVGTTIIVYNDGNQIFQGTVIRMDRQVVDTFTCKCFDNAFYLNKNKVRIQFNNCTVKDAITQLCSRENIPCEVACDIPTIVDKIYNGEYISKIIDDLLKLAKDDTGLTYRREYNNGSLYVNAMNNLKMIWDSEPIVGDFKQSYTIENIANNVIILSGNEKNTVVQATAKDDDSIAKYGQYTHYEKIDDKKIDKAQSIANKKLKELNRIVMECTLTLIGDDYVRSGRIIKFNQPEIALIGEYLVKFCEHRYTGDLHTMKVELEMNDNE